MLGWFQGWGGGSEVLVVAGDYFARGRMSGCIRAARHPQARPLYLPVLRLRIGPWGVGVPSGVGMDLGCWVGFKV